MGRIHPCGLSHARGRGAWRLDSGMGQIFLRANERRDAMRRHLGGGLILAAPPEVEPRARDAAPDLWSVRSLVLDLRPSTSDSGGRVNRDSHVIREIRGGPENVPADSAVDVEFSLAEAERIIRRIEGKPEYSVHGLARILLRAVEGLLERGASQKAFDVARKTTELLRGRSDAEPLLVDALSSLGRAARAENDVAAAVRFMMSFRRRTWTHRAGRRHAPRASSTSTVPAFARTSDTVRHPRRRTRPA